MYKPGTQLIITDLWAAAAAHKLGFEVEISVTHNGETLVWEWEEYLSDNLYFNLLYPDDDCETKVFITVTESGPNAAERFLPQVDDLVDTETPNKTSILGLGVGQCGAICKETKKVKIYGDAVNWRTCKSIIKRNGIPFPQFSEVIEP